MTVIIWKNQDAGSVAITYPIMDRNETMEEFARKFIKPLSRHYKIVTTDDLPANRFFFNEWVYNEEMPENPIEINVEKAHDHWKNVWRELRKPMLEKLDVEFMRALEDGDMELSRTIGQKKKLLRDITVQDLPVRVFGETVSEFSDKIMRIRPDILDWSSSYVPQPGPLIEEVVIPDETPITE